MAKNQVIDIDKGFAQLRKTLKSLQGRGSYVKVGVIGEAAAAQHPDEDSAHVPTNVDLAIMAEFGTPTAPARPFIGSTFELNKDKYVSLLAKGLQKVYENKRTVNGLLGLVGSKMAADIKERVTSRDNNFAPNAPSTIAKKTRKGERNRGEFIGPQESPRPLIDTGRMVGSVSYEVVGTTDEQGKGYSAPEVSESSGGGEE